MDGDFDQLRAAFASPQQHYYPSMGDALHEMDERANYGAPGTYHRQLHDQLQSGLAGFDALRDSMIPKTAADAGQMAAYMTPGLGNALSARDAYEGVQQGDWRKAALGGIGAVPFIGGIFAGPLAKTADHAMLARAGEMAAAGHAPEAIWRDTGWFKGPDQKWRFEIPDNEAKLVDPFSSPEMADRHIAASLDAKNRAGLPQALSLDDAITHPELSRAYWPIREDAPSVLFDNMGTTRGRYDRPNDLITLDSGNGIFNPEQQRSTALHELQHAIQGREGFGLGGTASDPRQRSAYDALRKQAAESDAVLQMRGRVEHLGETPSQAADYIAQARGMDPDRLMRLHLDFPGGDMQRRFEYSSQQARDADPNEVYRRLAGEVEARNVQSRMNMTPEERRATPPWETQDVPNEQQILRFR